MSDAPVPPLLDTLSDLMTIADLQYLVRAMIDTRQRSGNRTLCQRRELNALAACHATLDSLLPSLAVETG
jgi:hypothetical protein